MNTRLKPGDALLFVGDEFFDQNDANQWDFRILDSGRGGRGQRPHARQLAPAAGLDRSAEESGRLLPRAFALRRRAAVFGHNAPALEQHAASDFQRLRNMPSSIRRRARRPVLAHASADHARIGRVSLIADGGSHRAGHVDLDAVYSGDAARAVSWCSPRAASIAERAGAARHLCRALQGDHARPKSRAQEFALSGKVTRLGLCGRRTLAVLRRGARAPACSVSPSRWRSRISGEPRDHGRHASRWSSAPTASQPGRRLLVRGTRAKDGADVVHAATLVDATPRRRGPRHARDHAAAARAARARQRGRACQRGARVARRNRCANPGRRRCGEPFQRFELKQLPLTYRAPRPTRSAPQPSSRVRVDDIAWKPSGDAVRRCARRARLHAQRPTSRARLRGVRRRRARRAAAERREQRARELIARGSGARATSLPRSLTQLMTRPLGLKSVSNPLRGRGRHRSRARRARRGRRMPLGTRTLGRAVSLLDYEDFARAFSGIAKAQAQVLQLPAGPTVAITVAGAGRRALIAPASPVWNNLLAALEGERRSARRRGAARASDRARFRVGLKVKRDPDLRERSRCSRRWKRRCARTSLRRPRARPAGAAIRRDRRGAGGAGRRRGGPRLSVRRHAAAAQTFRRAGAAARGAHARGGGVGRCRPKC